MKPERIKPEPVNMVPLSRIAPQAVETLLDAAFGTDRHGRTAYKLRAGTKAIAGLSFAMVGGDGTLLGTIQCWPCGLFDGEGALVQALILVGPVAVAPNVQSKGLGKALMDATLEAAKTQADGPLMMIGDPDYYHRFFGFSAEETGAWEVPGPVERHRLLARAVRGEAIAREGVLGPRV